MNNYWYSKYHNHERYKKRLRLLFWLWVVQTIFLVLIIARGH